MFMRRVRMMGGGAGARAPPTNEGIAQAYGIGVKKEPPHLAADITNINPMLVAIFPDIAKVWKANTTHKPVITSGTDKDPKRVEDSDHPDGLAIDLRANYPDFIEKQAEIAKDLQEALGKDYWVNPEYFDNKALNHIHISYRPK